MHTPSRHCLNLFNDEIIPNFALIENREMITNYKDVAFVIIISKIATLQPFRITD
jgi:hypothetical protein